MTAKVIQGFFLGGQPKLASVQPKIAGPPPIQAKIAAPAPATAFAGQPPGPPIPALGARPPGPAFGSRPGSVQRHRVGNALAVDSGALGLAASGGKPLPDAVRSKMEAALGADFSGVRVHVGPQAERIGAIAFTVGSDVYFAPGRYQPDTVHGQQLLGHELAHVVQQRQGRVRNPLGSGLAVVQDHALEAEADRLGQRAAAHRVVAQAKIAPGTVQPSSRVQISAPMRGLEHEADAAGARMLAIAAHGTKGPSATTLQMREGIHNTRFSPISIFISGNHVIQRISEEEMNQARITFTSSAEDHGYSQESLESIIRHRFAEIQVGYGNQLLIGLGADEGSRRLGRIVYDCTYDRRRDEHHIRVYHAHGGQTEFQNPRGY